MLRNTRVASSSSIALTLEFFDALQLAFPPNLRLHDGQSFLLVTSFLWALSHSDYVCLIAGADVHSKTPLGRTALHVAAVMGRCDCIELLLSCGARALDPDSEGQTAVSLARLWGQQQSERTMIRFKWRRKSAAAVLPSSSESLAMPETSGHAS